MITSHEEISKRAREIWEREGRPEGRDMEHWLQAERELHGNSASHQVAGNTLAGAAASSGRDSNSMLNMFGGTAKEEGTRKRSIRRAR